MLYRADFLYDCADFYSLQSDPAVKLHGVLMRQIAPKQAEALHRSQYHPFSLYCRPTVQKSLIARLSVLAEETVGLLDSLEAQKSLTLYGLEQTVHLVSVKKEAPCTLQEAAERIRGELVELSFLTPASYRKDGRDLTPPSPEGYFTSVVRKLREFEGIDILQSEFQAAWQACVPISYRLELARHRITGYEKKGMVGEMVLRLPRNAEQAELMRTVLAYAEYSGIGGKTGQGMGGLLVRSCG